LAGFSTKLWHFWELLLHSSLVSVLVSAIPARIKRQVDAPDPDPRRISQNLRQSGDDAGIEPSSTPEY
jgi:hypothetical protein